MLDIQFHLFALLYAVLLLGIINLSIVLWSKYRVIRKCNQTIKAFDDELKIIRLRRDLDEKWKP